MKKFFVLVLAVMMIASMATVASATDNTTVLTTTVPAATYILNIPADQEITFGATETSIGNVTITNAAGFAQGKNLSITVTYNAFSAENVSTEIPYVLKLLSGTTKKELSSGSAIIFKGKSNGSVNETTMIPTAGNMGNYSDSPVSAILLSANSDDWGKALAGEYTSSIIFTCEVVVE